MSETKPNAQELERANELLARFPEELRGRYCGHKGNHGHPLDWVLTKDAEPVAYDLSSSMCGFLSSCANTVQEMESVTAAKDERIKELQGVLDSINSRTEPFLKLWREGHSDRKNALPDYAELVEYLALCVNVQSKSSRDFYQKYRECSERAEAAEAKIAELEQQLREIGVDIHISKAAGSSGIQALVNHRAEVAEQQNAVLKAELDTARKCLSGCSEELAAALENQKDREN